MKKDKSKTINDNGSFTTIEHTKITPEDGFVDESKVRSLWEESHSSYHKGHLLNTTFTTNDPRVTRPFVNLFGGLFLTIGIIMSLLRDWFFGIGFLVSAVFLLVKGNKDIDKIEQKLKEKTKDNDKNNIQE